MSGVETNSDGEEYNSEESRESLNGSDSVNSCDDSSDTSNNSGSSESEAESDEEEEIEPVLKYKRFARDVVASISQGQSGEESNVICCMAVHSKFIALGTFDGTIKLLDHTGTFLKDRDYTVHSDKINYLSVDEEGEFLASCSDDGKVNIVGLLTTKYNNTMSFDKQVKSVAIHPHFSKSTNHVFVIGTDRLVMVEERRWPLGNKITELHGGFGTISTIKWKENLIAWANEKMVIVYDTTLRERISSITFEEESPTYLPCSLYWQDTNVLLVGRGHIVKTVSVKEGEGEDLLSSYASDMDPSLRRKRYMAIIAQNTFPHFLICGVVPLFDGPSWNLIVLGYNADFDQQEKIRTGDVPPPHMVVIPPGLYSKEHKNFGDPKHITKDKLLPKGYAFCRCEEYHLECVLKEDRFYIISPIDILLAQKRDVADHIDWLLQKKDFEGAMTYAENPDISKQLPRGRMKDIGTQYIYYLIEKKKYENAARKCPEVLDGNDKNKWEDIILAFLRAKQVKVIRPYIPYQEPRLSAALYEIVLNVLLGEDCKMLYEVIKTWPNDLYNAKAIICAVNDKLKKDAKNSELLKVKASLHENLGQFDEALKIYLHQGHQEVFNLIHEKRLYSALLDNLIPLMEVDTKSTFRGRPSELQEAVKLLNDCKADVPPQRVVKELETFGKEEYLHKYLDCMFERDPKSGGLYHERQVELYAKFEPSKLLAFLRSCNDIPLQRALQVCEHYHCHEEMVYLLGRMGNQKRALKLIINELQDVDKAIEFAMEEGDEDLWELLISLSVGKPTFITGLLNNVGTHIDPTKLIKRIPDTDEIPHLRDSIVKLLQDFQVQVNLREGCKKILVKDSHSLMEKLHRLQKKAVYIDDTAICRTCGAEVIGTDDVTEYTVFFCGHIYHSRCVSMKNKTKTCRLCYAGLRKTVKQKVAISEH